MDKGAILQEARILFSQSPLKTKDCYNLTTKILYLLMKGDELNTKEATDVFFAVTKLFQSNDVRTARRQIRLTDSATALAAPHGLSSAEGADSRGAGRDHCDQHTRQGHEQRAGHSEGECDPCLVPHH
jgi:hypothetical protein